MRQPIHAQLVAQRLDELLEPVQMLQLVGHLLRGF
jgi:hypothetical protein